MSRLGAHEKCISGKGSWRSGLVFRSHLGVRGIRSVERLLSQIADEPSTTSFIIGYVTRNTAFVPSSMVWFSMTQELT